MRDERGFTPRDQRGFTLVEVFLAASILTTVLVAVSTMFILAMKLNTAAGDQTECVALGQERMERLKQSAYDLLVPGGNLDSPADGYYENVDVDSDGRNDYLVTWLITDATPVADSKGLQVRAKALRGEHAQLGPVKKVTFSTFKAKEGTI